MKRLRAFLGVLACLAAAAGCGKSDAPALEVRGDDAEMNAAVAKAQETLDVFLAALTKPEGKTHFAIKKGYLAGGQTEHIWVTDVSYDGTQFRGKISNAPALVADLEPGKRTRVQPSEVTDWMYVENGALVGARTLKVLHFRSPPAEQKAFEKKAGFDRPPMTSRKRVFLALDHKAADRIPVDFWASAGMIPKLERELGLSYAAFLDRYDVDLRYIEGPRYVGPPLEDGRDIWGVRRAAVRVELEGGAETYREVAESPLAGAESPDDVDRYAGWPSPDWFDYAVVEAQCDAVRDRGRVAVFMGDRMNRVAQLKPAMYLRGLEALFVDVAVRPELAAAIFGRIRRFYAAYIDRILDAARGKIDIVLTGDDFGQQNGMLMAPETWRRLLKPGFADYVRRIKARGARVMHHTCGSVVPILPDLIDCGLDVLQSVQPEAAGMSLAGLKARFGDRLCFHGGVSIQQTMPFGSPEDIRRAVRKIADAVKPGGGYIFCTAHNIQADTPVENAVALLEAYGEYGVY